MLIRLLPLRSFLHKRKHPTKRVIVGAVLVLVVVSLAILLTYVKVINKPQRQKAAVPLTCEQIIDQASALLDSGKPQDAYSQLTKAVSCGETKTDTDDAKGLVFGYKVAVLRAEYFTDQKTKAYEDAKTLAKQYDALPSSVKQTVNGKQSVETFLARILVEDRIKTHEGSR